MAKKAESSSGTIEFLLLAALLAASFIAFYPSLIGTKPYLDDSDPFSYVGVVLLMLAVQVVFFSFKLKPSPDIDGFAASIAFYLSSFGVFVFLPALLSLGFWSYRMDLLAFALFFAGSSFLLFGSRGARQMAFTIFYAFLAWPAVMLPIASLQPAITAFTGDVVQLLIQLLGFAIQRAPGNVFTSLTTEIPIIIAPQCIALSAILGFFTFMLPFAWFLEGKRRDKLLWLAFGVFLIIALNLLRIMVVIMVWNYQGITNAVSLFHSTSGNVMFNLAVIIAFIAFRLFRLTIPRLRGASLFSGKLAIHIEQAKKDVSSLPKAAVASLLFLAVATAAFTQVTPMVKSYSWLSGFEGQQYTAVQVGAGDLPVPFEWDQLATDTGFADEFIVSRNIFEQPSGEQVQVTVYSSGDASALSFRAEDMLASDNYTVSETTAVRLPNGITGRLVSYSKGERAYTSIYWPQPAQFGSSYTYAVFIFTVGDDAQHSKKQQLVLMADDFMRRL